MSEKIKAQHLQRKAILYIRQSSAFQVQHNQESQRLQYAMKERLEQLGWGDIEIIDDDQGCSGTGTVQRHGFERMVAEVCLGQIGAVAAREVSRFARNSRDWQQLVEMCRVVDTLLVDQDTVYAPRQSNDRLLLGLKGSLNEYELDLLRARSVEARHEKARRGELLVAAPVGFCKADGQHLQKDPDQRVQQAILLAFRKFQELGSVRQTLLWFLEERLQFPARQSRDETIWKRPTYATLYHVLTNPAYGGAYAYGRTETTMRYDGGRRRRGRRRRTPTEWLALKPQAHEGYVSWDEFQQFQAMIAANHYGNEARGAVKRGLALLTGLMRCRRCGRKLTVQYNGTLHRALRYGCVRGRLDQGEPKCIAFGGTTVDDAVTREIMRVVQPAAQEAAVLASQQASQHHDEVLAALTRDLEAARYEAKRAQKQYDTVDPENRLVAAELERRWNAAMTRVHALEQRMTEHSASDSDRTGTTIDEFQNLAAELETIWNNASTDVRLKKRIVRTLIEEVIADVDAAAGEVVLIIHWRGGVHTELHLPRRRRGQSSGHTAKEIVAAVRRLATICDDTTIAGVLNRNCLRTGFGNRWTRMRVTSLRCRHGIPVHCPQRQEAEGWMTLTAAAKFMGISMRTLRLAVQAGQIAGDHPLSDGPWIFQRQALQTASAQRVIARAQSRNGDPTVPGPEQPTLDFSDK